MTSSKRPVRGNAPARAAVAAFLLLAGALGWAAPSVRIKDIAYLQGVRGNQILGLGLVTGLSGKGDSQSSPMLQSSLSTLMSNFGFSMTPADIRSRNCAVVMVSGELPPFAREGDTMDVSVSSIGDARDLSNGILLQTNLQAANGQVYAVAQGSVLGTPDPSGARTVGRIPNGAIIERQALSQYIQGSAVSLVLRNPDFITADAVQKAIEAAFPDVKTTSTDPSIIQIPIPEAQRAAPVAFLAQLEALTLTPDGSGRVVINSSSGVIVMGDKVRIGKVVVSYMSARVTVGSPSYQSSSQKTAASDLFTIPDTATVDDFVTALKTVGLKADAIIAILQAIEKAGSLFGTLVIM